MNKLVSVIIPAYNAGNYIQQTLNSVIEQSYPNWECLVVDDGSTDNTQDIVKKISATESRIQYHYKTNGGLSSARNFGIKLAKGNYIQYLDSDDILYSDKFKLMLQQYETLKKNDVILFSDFMYGMDTNPFQKDTNNFKLFKKFNSTTPIKFKQVYCWWDKKITIPIHCFLFPKELIKDILFDEALRSKEDWDYHLSVLNNKACLKPFNYTGCIYRVTANSMSKNYTLLVQASLIVLHKWKKNRWLYVSRVSYYLLQSHIYRLKKNDIAPNAVTKCLKNLHTNYFPVLFGAYALIPFQLAFKLISSIRIRL